MFSLSGGPLITRVMPLPILRCTLFVKINDSESESCLFIIIMFPLLLCPTVESIESILNFDFLHPYHAMQHATDDTAP